MTTKKTIGLILCNIILILQSSVIYAKNHCKEFTDEEIKQNIVKYVTIVFGKKTPTLQDYYNLEGENAENELIFELDECKRRGWIPTIDSLECIQFTKERSKKAVTVPSYYYNFIRTFLKKNDENLVIHNINRDTQRNKDELKTVLVDASLGKISLQFYHAGDICAAQLGLVMLYKIDNNSISKLIEQTLEIRHR